MPIKGFHPAVARWFASTFDAPTDVQRAAWPQIQHGRATLIAAPTGAGKTLAAFLVALDGLLKQGLQSGSLPDETGVVYVSPLKALSTDIHVNLALPREGIQLAAEAMGFAPPQITTAIRTGDTSPAARASIVRRPPHILVTTPESLYLLLTARRSRAILQTVRTVIVDEIHAVFPSRRGAHLTLSLERLAHVSRHPIQRIGLSATQKPVETIANFLTGGSEDCAIVDLGHWRKMDLGLEVPQSPLEAVMAHEVWAEIYDRIAELSADHRTTLVFVGTRHLAERMARHLGERLGTEAVAAHHGSLAQDRRQEAERKLKQGELKVLVATASLELGVDIGSVDLVCQIGSPRTIATFLQRVGRAGHYIGGVAKGRLFPVSRDDLVECVALLDAVRRGELESVRCQTCPTDVLAQQIVAEVAAEEWNVDQLFALCRRAWSYRELTRESFDEAIAMCARGFDTARGRRGALIYHDRVNSRVKGRPAARLIALTSGGAIPDTADYRVILEPSGTPVGSVFEDFAVESFAGDVFQLGNTAWRILNVSPGIVRVEDAQGATPTLPFWRSEVYARSDELSYAISRLRAESQPHLTSRAEAQAWLQNTYSLAGSTAQQMAEYLCTGIEVLGRLPVQDGIIAERFFDDSGGMQLVLHAPFGARINRAWGLALRKKFCRKFNFELQAAANENNILLSIGPQHSFPLEDVFSYVQPEVLADTLVQAILDAPMFQTRWRWVLNLALAVPRARGGKKVAPQLQRMQADDILVVIFPDAAACLENVAGERSVPAHPLIDQAIADCLHEAMDCIQLEHILRDIRHGNIACHVRDTAEPSPLAHEVLTVGPYAFLDDAPLEERRAQAAYRRRAYEPSSASHDLGLLDTPSLEHTLAEVQPLLRDADELHDALLMVGWMPASVSPALVQYFKTLASDGRATCGTIEHAGACVWLPAERLHEAQALWRLTLDPPLVPLEEPCDDASEAAASFTQGFLETSPPVTAAELAGHLHITTSAAEAALLTLESRGVVLRGIFTAGASGERQWCHRRLLARVHRRTINRLRSEIAPVSQADYMRFLLAWQKVAPEYHVAGPEGLWSVIVQLSGFALQAAAWESEVLPARVEDYQSSMLDQLCMAGQVGWRRPAVSVSNASGPVRTTPIGLFLREQASLFATSCIEEALSSAARRVLDVLRERGASFLHVLENESGLLPTQVEAALGELVTRGLITSDGFGGLRFLITPVDKRRRSKGRTPNLDALGRWSIVSCAPAAKNGSLEQMARVILRRYGIVCRRILTREQGFPPWRELVRTFWDMEMRGDVRGGRFIDGVPGEHFGLPEAVGLLRHVRRDKSIAASPVGLSAVDPLNLAGIVGPGARVSALASNRLVYENGEVVATLIGDHVNVGGLTPAIRKVLFTQCAALQPAVLS